MKTYCAAKVLSITAYGVCNDLEKGIEIQKSGRIMT